MTKRWNTVLYHGKKNHQQHTFLKEAGRRNEIVREPIRREVLTLLPSSFQQNFYPVQTFQLTEGHGRKRKAIFNKQTYNIRWALCVCVCVCFKGNLSRLVFHTLPPLFTCQTRGGTWAASRHSWSSRSTVDWISGQWKATLGTMTRHSLPSSVDQGGTWLFGWLGVHAAPINIKCRLRMGTESLPNGWQTAAPHSASMSRRGAQDTQPSIASTWKLFKHWVKARSFI